MKLIPDKIKQLLSFKHANRSDKAKKNIILLFITHSFNFITLLLVVPLTLDYLGPVEYGIWLTINSLLVWVGYLDLGIGNGLRIKLGESIAAGDFEKAKIYTSTAYAVFSAGMLLFLLIFLIANQFLDWSEILNTPAEILHELNILAAAVFSLFLIQFVLRLLTFIINADQRAAINGVLGFIINLLTVIFLYFINKSSSGSLLTLGIGISFIPIIVFFFASVYLFRTFFSRISPSVNKVNLKFSKDLIVLGGQFFVIQAAGLVVFATDNMIITQILGPSEVTVYNIAYRYFYFIPMLFNLILTPVLPAYTEAYAKDDHDWIKNAMGKIIKIWMLLSLVIIVMLAVSDTAYRIWVGSEVSIPFSLSIAMGIFAIVTNWNNIFAFFLNGVGKIRLQFYASIFIAFINIPVSIYFAVELGFGITGVVMGTIFCLLIGAVWAPIQSYKIINKKDIGIWGK